MQVVEYLAEMPPKSLTAEAVKYLGMADKENPVLVIDPENKPVRGLVAAFNRAAKIRKVTIQHMTDDGKLYIKVGSRRRSH